VSLEKVPVLSDDLDPGTLLFSESPSRFLVEVELDNVSALEAALAQVPFARIGDVTSDDLLSIAAGGEEIVQSPVEQLKATWQATLAEGNA
jgi:phosphoribosylformylglycinamidine synthase